MSKAGDKGRKWTKISARTVALMNGEDNVEDWDDEELFRGHRRDSNGNFTGRPPKLVPQQAHRELLKRRLKQAELLMVDALPAATKTLVAIMESPFAEDRDRIKAAQLVIERVMGKAIERVEVGITNDPPWMEALQAGIVDIETEQPAIGPVPYDDDDDEIIDAEIIED